MRDGCECPDGGKRIELDQRVNISLGAGLPCRSEGELLATARGEAAFFMEGAMRKHRNFDDLPCFRDHA